jgi:hypothetical protein
MNRYQKLDLVYSFRTYTTPAKPLTRKEDFLIDDDRPLLKFLGDSEKVEFDDKRLFNISMGLNWAKYSQPDLENLNFFPEFEYGRSTDKIRKREDVYGEVTRNGVETLAKKLQEYIKETSDLEFIDLGAGKGKLVLHLSLISNFKWYTGVELCENKFSESLTISALSTISDKVTLINGDMFSLDLSKYDVVFFNDVCFRESLRQTVFRSLKQGCYVVTSKVTDLTFISGISLECSWNKSKDYYIYRK